MGVILLLISGCATWTPQDKILGVASCVAAAADTYTTIQFLDNPDNYERNPMLGKHPSDTEVIIYMAMSQIITLIIADIFIEWRSWILGGKTALNTGWAINNRRLEK